MASTKEYLDFVLEQLSGLDEISNRAMMGEYILYYRGRVFGGIYDDRLLVKPVPAAVKLMPDASMELPYDGAKEMILVDDIDNREFLCELVEAMYEELPVPKKKKKYRIFDWPVGKPAGLFSYRGLKLRIFSDWDVRGRATSGRENPFFMALPPRTRWRCHMTVEEMKAVDIRSVSRDDLVDIRDVVIDQDAPKEERIKSFLRQIKNPYCFKVGNVVVKTTFADTDVTLDDRLEHYFRNK